MKIYADRFETHLQQGLQPVYALTGSEPLLIEECKTLIERRLKAQHIDEFYRYTIDGNSDWSTIFDHFDAMSLFSSQTMVELTVSDAGLNATITKQFQELAGKVNPDTLLVLVLPKLTKAQENSKWAKSFTDAGCCWVNCLAPDLQRLPQFIMARCKKLQLSPDPQALQMLAQWHEGNLLALAQSLEKLKLQFPDGDLTLVRLQESLTRHNHFTAFHWCDAILAGKANRAQRILRQLEEEGLEPVLLLRTIQKEILQLWQFKQLSETQSLARIFDEQRVWNNRRPFYQYALSHLTFSTLRDAINQLAELERAVKKEFSSSPWSKLQQLTLTLSLPAQS